MRINFKLNSGDEKGEAPVGVNSVRVLKLCDDYLPLGQKRARFSSKGWCEKLAKIFPNLEQLMVKLCNGDSYFSGDFRKEMDENRGLFKQLKVLKLIVDNESGEM